MFQYENAQIAYPKDTANRFKELEEYAKSEVKYFPFLYIYMINIMICVYMYIQEKRAQEFIKLAEGEVENLRKEFDRWDNVPPADEVTYELGMFTLKFYQQSMNRFFRFSFFLYA